jgi:hypothetical protein
LVLLEDISIMEPKTWMKSFRNTKIPQRGFFVIIRGHIDDKFLTKDESRRLTFQTNFEERLKERLDGESKLKAEQARQILELKRNRDLIFEERRRELESLARQFESSMAMAPHPLNSLWSLSSAISVVYWKSGLWGSFFGYVRGLLSRWIYPISGPGIASGPSCLRILGDVQDLEGNGNLGTDGNETDVIDGGRVVHISYWEAEKIMNDFLATFSTLYDNGGEDEVNEGLSDVD